MIFFYFFFKQTIIEKCHFQDFLVFLIRKFFLKIAVAVVKMDVETPTKSTGCLKHHILFLIKNSILKISGSTDIRITPDFFS